MLLPDGDVAVFNDVTARDMQNTARRAGNPWTLSKSMDTFAPMSRPVPLASVEDVHQLELVLTVNGEVRQRGNTADMVFPPERLISYISRYMTLEEGDIIAIDIPKKKITLKVAAEELKKRKKEWKPKTPAITTGYLARYAKLVTSASTGAIFKD